MAELGLARRRLGQARFFAIQASMAGRVEREAFENFLEAAIVFGRSITHQLQKEYRHHPDFEKWYSAKQESMGHDPLLRFFLERRNFILKEGPVGFHKKVSVVINATVQVSETLAVRVIRGQPWYRRSPRIVWQDLLRTAMQPVRMWLSRRQAKHRRWQAHQRSEAVVTEGFLFDNSEWNDRPATDLLRDHLDRLEEIVNEAEARFGG